MVSRFVFSLVFLSALPRRSTCLPTRWLIIFYHFSQTIRRIVCWHVTNVMTTLILQSKQACTRCCACWALAVLYFIVFISPPMMAWIFNCLFVCLCVCLLVWRKMSHHAQTGGICGCQYQWYLFTDIKECDRKKNFFLFEEQNAWLCACACVSSGDVHLQPAALVVMYSSTFLFFSCANYCTHVQNLFYDSRLYRQPVL